MNNQTNGWMIFYYVTSWLMILFCLIVVFRIEEKTNYIDNYVTDIRYGEFKLPGTAW